MQKVEQLVNDAIESLQEVVERAQFAIVDLRDVDVQYSSAEQLCAAAEAIADAIKTIEVVAHDASRALDEAKSAAQRIEDLADKARIDVIDQEIGDALIILEEEGEVIIGDLLEDDARYVADQIEAAGCDVDVRPDDDKGGYSGLWIVSAVQEQE